MSLPREISVTRPSVSATMMSTLPSLSCFIIAPVPLPSVTHSTCTRPHTNPTRWKTGRQQRNTTTPLVCVCVSKAGVCVWGGGVIFQMHLITFTPYDSKILRSIPSCLWRPGGGCGGGCGFGDRGGPQTIVVVGARAYGRGGDELLFTQGTRA